MNKCTIYMFVFLYLCNTSTYSVSTHQMKEQLNKISNQMGALQKNLSQAENTKVTLSQTLATIEKQISLEIINIRETQNNINKKKQTLVTLEKENQKLSQQIETQQNLLGAHLRQRYQTQKPPPLQLLLNQHNPHTINRLITYHQYMIRADEQFIQQVRDTYFIHTQNQEKIKAEYQALQTLERNLLARQKKLIETKQQQHQVMQTVTHAIQTKQQQLKTYQQDRMHLEILLKQLTENARIKHMKPVSRVPVLSNHANQISSSKPIKLNGQFKTPISSAQNSKYFNQGMLFSAQEGTPVHAILPGKVIFSDWLNGYGLLIIIEHEHGMMSLYAHNESLFKSKGNLVKSGDKIATVGHTGGIRENGLYFELRRRGKVVPPRQWLA